MKKLITIAVLMSVVGFGCSSPAILVHALEPPKWPVAPGRTIGVVAILEDKQGRDAHLTRDVAALLTKSLKQSAYYTKVGTAQISAGEFNVGQYGEKIPLEQTIKAQAQELTVDLLLFVEVLHSNVSFDLGHNIGYGIGISRAYRYGAFGASIGSGGTSYWNADCRMLVNLILASRAKGSILAGAVEPHTLQRSYSGFFPSETDLLQELVMGVTAHALTFVDVYFHPSPRYLRSDGTTLVADGIHFALLGDPEGWRAAEELWHRARKQNPGSIAASYNLAVAAEMREDYAAAAPLYKAAADLSGEPGAFEREMYEASHSAGVLAKFGAPKETKEPPKQPPSESPKKPEPAPDSKASTSGTEGSTSDEKK